MFPKHTMDPLNTILYLADIKKLTPQHELLPVISKSLAEKTQTLVFDKHENILSVLTTNQFPELYHQVEDKLIAK